ncbi:hypothetical protein P4N68_09460 [Corynebacterium felinum]|uniref:Uncharacterized protein n=1 Tax=Corynebacterium felinum TaxID=131318 RepID=A0ABU2B8V2_9CORY|nr:hypothetical protein [Corynebacterium felinum]MDF5821302.1 hypothetical protein [Corynebacterium felinum]MDR7354816.1 hypothetical protein [Corynebacterium felinum]WJY94176.1 hypothetical protein CFELI_02670 [Corynebacterium felinum]
MRTTLLAPSVAAIMVASMMHPAATAAERMSISQGTFTMVLTHGSNEVSSVQLPINAHTSRIDTTGAGVLHVFGPVQFKGGGHQGNQPFKYTYNLNLSNMRVNLNAQTKRGNFVADYELDYLDNRADKRAKNVVLAEFPISPDFDPRKKNYTSKAFDLYRVDSARPHLPEPLPGWAVAPVDTGRYSLTFTTGSGGSNNPTPPHQPAPPGQQPPFGGLSSGVGWQSTVALVVSVLAAVTALAGLLTNALKVFPNLKLGS